MKKRIRKLLSPKARKAAKLEEQVREHLPKITNETVAEHREEVLSSARKYIYPLQHSKHKIVLITTSLFIAALVGFFGFTTFSLYKLKSHSAFLYGVTQVIPFPIAKAGNNFVAYENYLFELKHYIHYYQNEQKLDFNSESGKQQLQDYKKRALNKVINDAYIKMMAKDKKVSVSDVEVNDEIKIVKTQNRLGGSDKVFEDVLKQYWGWTTQDFKRNVKTQLMEQKLMPELDPEAMAKAKAAKAELDSGVSFADVAKKYSEDQATKDNGGEYESVIDKTNRDITPRTADAIFKLKPGQVSDVINSGYCVNTYCLEIVKNIEVQGEKVRAAHIVINFKDINGFINDLKDKKKATVYIKL